MFYKGVDSSILKLGITNSFKHMDYFTLIINIKWEENSGFFYYI
jgi:hypothetical protein